MTLAPSQVARCTVGNSLNARPCPLASERRLQVPMDPSATTVECPDCAHPLVLSEFRPWAAQTYLKTIVCAECSSTVTFPTHPDGSVDAARPPFGRGLHGTTREARGREVLLSRPALEQQE